MASSPIYKLNQDILWSIFSINANMNVPLRYDSFRNENLSKYSAFDTTVHSSQVCHSWRNLLLQSPTIWGNVLRVDRLNQWKDEGRKEILKRTGEALLCLQGNLGGTPKSYSFFIRVVDSELSRVRKIDVRIGCECNKAWEELFARPAPHLQSFKVLFQFNHNGQPNAANEETFFGGTAPSLRELHTKFIRVNIHAPWAKPLRSLRLVSADHIADDTLEAIRSMPLLEYLDLSILGSPLSAFPAERSLYFPKLAHLRLSCSPRINLAFAHAIDPSESCALFWTEKSTAENTSSEEISIMRSVLARYAGMYFAARKIKFVALHPGLDTFKFQASPNDSFEPEANSEDLQPFFIELNRRLADGTIPLLLLSMSGCDFSSVTRINFQADFLFGEWPNVSTFFRSLLSIVIVDISERGMELLLDASKDEIMFPSLQRLTIHYLYCPGRSKISSVRSFIAYRKSLRYPIAVLGLAIDRNQEFAAEENQLGDWSSLEDIDGLKVMWEQTGSQFEYTCGSGHPEQLNFPSDSFALQVGL